MTQEPTYEDLVNRIKELKKINSEHEITLETISKREQEYRTPVLNIPGMIYRGKPDWTLDIIKNSKNLCGYSSDELKNQKVNWLDIIHPDDKKRVFDESLKKKGETNAIRQEYRIIAKDKSTRWVKDLKTIIYKEDGSLKCVDGIVYDITEKKEIEKKLEKLNNLKQNLLSVGLLADKMKRITDGTVDILQADFARIWLTKPGDLCDSGCIHANVTKGPHVCHDRKRCLHLIASSGRYTHIDGDHRRVPFGCYKIGSVASGDEPGFLTNDVTQDPRVHNHDWTRELGLVSCAGYRLISQKGTPIGVLSLFSKKKITKNDEVILQTITSAASEAVKFSAVMEELQESELKFRNLSDQSLVGVYLIQDGQFKYINHKFAEMFGYPMEEYLDNMLFSKLVYPEDLSTVEYQVNKRIKNQAEFSHYTFRGQKKTGEIVHVEIYGSSTSLGGKPAALGTIMDITDRIKAEQEKEILILDLREALQDVKRLSGLLPLCSYCKKIRDDKGYWNQIESYIHEHSEAEFSHGICEKCAEKHFPGLGLYDD